MGIDEWRAHQHTGYIQYTGDGMYFPVCTVCGTLGPANYSNKEQAQVLLDAHAAGTGITVWPVSTENLDVDDKGCIYVVDVHKPWHYIQRRWESI